MGSEGSQNHNTITPYVPGVDEGPPNYTLKDLSISTDVLTLDPIFVSLMDNLCSGEAGLLLPFESYTSNVSEMPWQSNQTLLISQGASHLKSLYCFFQPTDLTRSAYHIKSDSYYMNRINSYQYQVGSSVFPLNRVESPSVALSELYKALGQHSTGTSTLIDRDNYLGYMGIYKQHQQVTPNGNAYDTQHLKAINLQRGCGGIGLNTERVLGFGGNNLSGISTKLRGYQVQLRLEFDTFSGLNDADATLDRFGRPYNRYIDWLWRSTAGTPRTVTAYQIVHQDKLLIIKNNAIAVSD